MQYRAAMRVGHPARWLSLIALACAAATPSSGSDGILSIDEVRSQLKERRATLKSLHTRIRRVTEFAGDPSDARRLLADPTLPVHSGTDILLEAFKSDLRYRRVVKLDKPRALLGGQAAGNVPIARRWYVDTAKAWTGAVMLHREAGPGSGRKDGNYCPRFQYRTAEIKAVQDSFPPATYLATTGFAVADPTGRDEGMRNLQRLGDLPSLLGRRPYKIIRQTEMTEGASCLVVEGRFDCLLPWGETSRSESIIDTVWLDRQRGLAIRKRVTQIGSRLRQVSNRDLVEVASGLWLPRHSELKGWTVARPTRADKPIVACTLKLSFWVVNEVPDDVFTVALTPPARASLFQLAPAFHWRNAHGTLNIEGWAVRDVGVRVEHRSPSGKLLMLVVDTPQWRVTWRPDRNSASVQRSRLRKTNGFSLISPNVQTREHIVRWNEALTAVLSSRHERHRGTIVERLLVHLPSDPQLDHAANLHHADPQVLRGSPPEAFYSRRYWFDPATNLIVARQCGCKNRPPPDRDDEPATTIDYPAVESLPPDLFVFEFPPAARVTVLDPKLKRLLPPVDRTRPAER